MNVVLKSFKRRLQLRMKQMAKVKTSASETGEGIVVFMRMNDQRVNLVIMRNNNLLNSFNEPRRNQNNCR